MRISDWSSDVCSSDLAQVGVRRGVWDDAEADREARLLAEEVEAERKAARRQVAAEIALGEGDDGGDEEQRGPLVDPPPEQPPADPSRQFNFGSEIGRASCRERVCQSV